VIRPVEKKTVKVEKKPAVIVPKVTINDEINLLLKQQNYHAALATAHQGIENGYPESALSSEYLQALLGVLRQAEESMRKGALDKAGSSFQAALNHYPRNEELTSLAPMSADQIKTKIDTCANQLMEDGLLAYRAGNLGTAIGIWEKILLFQPQHEASQKAIHTANLQLTNLKSLVKQQ
jgi:tetratricopeptide (TPR) repeat protein